MTYDNNKEWFCDKYKDRLKEKIKDFEDEFGSMFEGESKNEVDIVKKTKARREIQWFFERMQLSELRKSNASMKTIIDKLKSRIEILEFSSGEKM